MQADLSASNNTYNQKQKTYMRIEDWISFVTN
jgi:hypothetical protein